MDKLDMEIINKDINTHKDIVSLKLELKNKNILLSIGIVENIDGVGENINIVIQDNNKTENRGTIIPIPEEVLYWRFDDIIGFIIDHFV